MEKIKQEVFQCEYKENENSNQLIYSPDQLADEKDYAVFDKKYIFPLKYEKFEHLLVPIPNDPINHLYEHGNYGEKGDVMCFPHITDYGFSHTQNTYDDLDMDFDEIYSDLCNFAEKYKNNLKVNS